jgi:hypothetical protein
MNKRAVLVSAMGGMLFVIQGCAPQQVVQVLQQLSGLLGAGQATGGLGGSQLGGAPLGTPLTGSLPLGPGQGAPPPAGPAAPGAPPAGGPITAGTSAELENWRGGRLPPAQFFRMLAPAAIAASRQTGVPAAVTLAQAALETGYGASTIGDAKNLFGIKGTGPAGSITSPTREVYNGRSVTENATFRKYNTWVESIMDHDRLLSTAARYRGAMAVRNDPEAFARAIHQAGYATDPEYSNKLIKIMRDNNLVGLTQQA